jgi:hypothetical protein
MVIIMMNMFAKQLVDSVKCDLKGEAIFEPLDTHISLLKDKLIIAPLHALSNIIIILTSLQVII